MKSHIQATWPAKKNVVAKPLGVPKDSSTPVFQAGFNEEFCQKMNLEYQALKLDERKIS